MTLADKRNRACAKLLAEVHAITAREGVNPSALHAFKLELVALGRHTELFPLTDFAMPGRNGVETIRSARETRPDLRAVLMTGYADDESVATMRDAISVLRKPIDLRELVKALA